MQCKLHDIITCIHVNAYINHVNTWIRLSHSQYPIHNKNLTFPNIKIVISIDASQNLKCTMEQRK